MGADSPELREIASRSDQSTGKADYEGRYAFDFLELGGLETLSALAMRKRVESVSASSAFLTSSQRVMRPQREAPAATLGGDIQAEALFRGALRRDSTSELRESHRLRARKPGRSTK